MKTDSQLKQDVTNELTWEPAVNEAQIGVGVTDGIVTLSGHVPTYGERFCAEKAAKRVLGVRAVANELVIRLASDRVRSDEDIAALCLRALEAHAALPEERLKLVVHDGWVTIDGHLDWQYQKTAAEEAIRNLIGVRGITNAIEITPRATAIDVKDKIQDAFKRSAEVDADRVNVEAADGKVILRGRVRSWTEKNEAVNAAWSAPGVLEVDNELEVMP
jgi:osmotically-inducible protein OsmY